jgi:hypothetical protein
LCQHFANEANGVGRRQPQPVVPRQAEIAPERQVRGQRVGGETGL